MLRPGPAPSADRRSARITTLLEWIRAATTNARCFKICTFTTPVRNPCDVVSRDKRGEDGGTDNSHKGGTEGVHAAASGGYRNER